MIEHSHNVAHYGLRIALILAIWFVLACIVGVALGKTMKRMDGR